MNMIVAADKQLGIGYKGDLLVHIPFDQQCFRRQTMGKVVVMGRKTFESLPGGQPLDGRINIVLTEDRTFKRKNVTAVHSIDEAADVLKDYNQNDIFIIGGESIYEQFLPYTDHIYMTKIDYIYDADRHFPKLSAKDWVMTHTSDEQTYFDLIYHFCIYERKNAVKAL